MPMNDSQWDAKLKSFLKKTGEDFKRTGNDLKAEAEKLLKEVQDPERQAKVKAGMKEFGGWAKKAAEEMAELMETGVKKAEGVINKATDKVVDFTAGQKKTASAPVSEEAAGAPEGPAIPDPTPPNPPAAEAKPAKKSIGGKKRKPSTKKAAASKKSLGKTPAKGDETPE